MITVGDFNIPLTPMDRSTKQKISKETQILNDTIDQLDLIDIYRTFHPKTMNFTFFSSTHRTFSRIDHSMGRKSSPHKLKKKIGCTRSSLLLRTSLFAASWGYSVVAVQSTNPT